MFERMNAGTKAILLLFGGYVVTMGIAALIVTAAVILLSETHSCSTMGRALLALWATIAALFVASVVVVGVVVRKIAATMAGRWAIVAAYGLAMLASLIVIAFGLMVAFNC